MKTNYVRNSVGYVKEHPVGTLGVVGLTSSTALFLLNQYGVGPLVLRRFFTGVVSKIARVSGGRLVSPLWAVGGITGVFMAIGGVYSLVSYLLSDSKQEKPEQEKPEQEKPEQEKPAEPAEAARGAEEEVVENQNQPPVVDTVDKQTPVKTPKKKVDAKTVVEPKPARKSAEVVVEEEDQDKDQADAKAKADAKAEAEAEAARKAKEKAERDKRAAAVENRLKALKDTDASKATFSSRLLKELGVEGATQDMLIKALNEMKNGKFSNHTKMIDEILGRVNKLEVFSKKDLDKAIEKVKNSHIKIKGRGDSSKKKITIKLFNTLKTNVEAKVAAQAKDDASKQEQREESPVDTPVDQNVDTPVDQNVDTPEDQNVDTPEDQNVDTPEDQNVDTPEDQNVDTPEDQNVDTPEDQNVDTPEDQNVDTPEDQNVDTPEDQNVDTPEDQNVDTPEDQNVDTPEDQNVDTSEDQNVDTPEDQNVDTPEDQNVDTPEDQNVDTPEDQNVDTPEDQNVDTSEDQNVDTPEDQNVDTPEDQNVDTPEDQNVDTPEDQNVDTSEDQNVDTPEDQNVDTPEDQNVDTPEDQNVDTPEDQNVDTPEDQNVDTPLTPEETPNPLLEGLQNKLKLEKGVDVDLMLNSINTVRDSFKDMADKRIQSMRLTLIHEGLLKEEPVVVTVELEKAIKGLNSNTCTALKAEINNAKEVAEDAMNKGGLDVTVGGHSL
jgi:hypothetical protein